MRNDEIVTLALKELKLLNYRYLASDKIAGESIKIMLNAEGEERKIKIQGRGPQKQSSRYLVGLMERSLHEVDEVVLLFSTEANFYIVETEWLKRRLTDMRRPKIQKNQWHVNIDCMDDNFQPVYGDPSNMSRFSHKRVRN